MSGNPYLTFLSPTPPWKCPVCTHPVSRAVWRSRRKESRLCWGWPPAPEAQLRSRRSGDSRAGGTETCPVLFRKKAAQLFDADGFELVLHKPHLHGSWNQPWPNDCINFIALILTGRGSSSDLFRARRRSDRKGCLIPRNSTGPMDRSRPEAAAIPSCCPQRPNMSCRRIGSESAKKASVGAHMRAHRKQCMAYPAQVWRPATE